MIFKSREIERHFQELPSRLLWILISADEYMRRRFGKPLMIVNVSKEGPDSKTHSDKRAADARILYGDRDRGFVEYIKPSEAREVAAWINRRFSLPEGDMIACLVHGEPLHFHFQIGRTRAVIPNFNVALPEERPPKGDSSMDTPEKTSKSFEFPISGILSQLLPIIARYVLDRIRPDLENVAGHGAKVDAVVSDFGEWADNAVKLPSILEPFDRPIFEGIARGFLDRLVKEAYPEG